MTSKYIRDTYTLKVKIVNENEASCQEILS